MKMLRKLGTFSGFLLYVEPALPTLGSARSGSKIYKCLDGHDIGLAKATHLLLEHVENKPVELGCAVVLANAGDIGEWTGMW